MEIKKKEPHDKSKALFDMTCCITDATTKLAAKLVFSLIESETFLMQVEVY